MFCLAGRVRRGLRGVEGRVFGAEGGREGCVGGSNSHVISEKVSVVGGTIDRSPEVASVLAF